MDSPLNSTPKNSIGHFHSCFCSEVMTVLTKNADILVKIVVITENNLADWIACLNLARKMVLAIFISLFVQNL